MCKSFEKVKFHHGSHGKLKNEITKGGNSLAETKIERDIFHGNSLLPVLIVKATKTLNYILR